MKQQILSSAWELYHSHSCTVKLGMCIRAVCSQMQKEDYKYLSKLDGQPAIDFFNQHYYDRVEEQFNAEGM